MSNTIQVNPLKIRLSPDKDPFYIYRDSKLRFVKKQTSVDIHEDYTSDGSTNAREEKEMTPGGKGQGI